METKIYTCEILQVNIFVELLQEGGPLPGPESGLLSTTQKWSVQRNTRADETNDFIGKGLPGGEQQGKGSQENCFAHMARSLGFYGNGVRFWLISGQSLWLRVLPGGACVARPRWIPARRILGGWQDIWAGVSSFLVTFPKLFPLVVAC